LYNAKNEVVGFSIISDINNRVLMTASGEAYVELLNQIKIMEEVDDSNGILIYDFPNGFYFKNKEGIIQLFISGETIVVDKIFDNGVNEIEFLKGHSSNNMSKTLTVYGKLDDWDHPDFVPVQVPDEELYYYGGFQGWLTDEGVSTFYANRSCGVTAASNMMQYMSEHVSGKSDLYTQATMYKYDFSAYQKDVYDYLNPAIWGIPGIDTMISKVKSFALSEGVVLNEVTSNDTWNETNVRNYIAGGLNSESPVLLVTWDSIIDDLEKHWVTVTKLYGSDGNITMLTSNWAGKAEYDFSLWVSGGSLYRGVIYFE